MRATFIVVTTVAIALAGCQWAGETSLGEPQPVLGPDNGYASADDPLGVLSHSGATASPRFETPSYTGLQQNSFAEVGADLDPSVSPDGKQIVFASTRHSTSADIYVKSTSGTTVTRLTNDPANDIQPVLSPDGRYIAYASDRTGNWDIFVMTSDGRKPFQVTSSLAHEIHPSWSPDGGELCFSQYNNRSGQWELWVVEVGNPANKRFLTYGLFPVWCPSPSVNRIAFQVPRQRGTKLYSIWTTDLVDGEARKLTEVVAATSEWAAVSPCWSPDGRCLVYTTVRYEPPAENGTARSDMRRGDDIWIATIDGKSRIRLTGDHMQDWSPNWAPDGRIYFSSNRGGPDNIWSLKPLDTQLIQATRVSPTRVGDAGGPAAQPADAEAAVKTNRADM